MSRVGPPESFEHLRFHPSLHDVTALDPPRMGDLLATGGAIIHPSDAVTVKQTGDLPIQTG